MLSITSCTTTSHVPDDDQLFIGLNKIEYSEHEKNDNFYETQAEVEAALATKPNGALFGSSYYRTPFPYGLWIWNATHDAKSKFGQWLNRTFGKAPVLMSQVNPALRASVAKSVLRKYGYLHGDVTYEEVTQKNPKKAKITYKVKLDSLFLIDSMEYTHFPPTMQALIDSTLDEAYVRKGSPLSASLLDAERNRVSLLMRNNGYFYYQPNFTSYLADTFDVANRAKVRLQLADSLPEDVMRQMYIGKTSVLLRRSFAEKIDSTISLRTMSLSFGGKRTPIRMGVVMGNMKLRPRQLYSYDNYMESVQKLNATGVFSSIDLQFKPRGRDTLDLSLNCTLDKPYDVYFEANAVNRTIGRAGPELKIGFTKRNAFRGAEKLDINLHSAYQWQTTGNGERMNSYQYGIDASVEFPRIVLPWTLFKKRRIPTRTPGDTANIRRPRRPRQFFSTPTSFAKVSADVNRRPKYYKMNVVTGEWGYKWQPRETMRHEFSPLTLKYQHMDEMTDTFAILMIQNPYILASMSDVFIPKMRYTFTYTSPKGTRNPIRWETTVEESGNFTALYDVLIQGNSWNQKDKTLFKNPYSQFFKLQTDLTKTWNLDTKSQLVGHINYGVMWNYGNSTDAPFSEMFYAGGANSVRAFPIRTLGPGSFVGDMNDKQYGYMMQNGDIRLILNLEYRRHLFGNLYGAVFLDAGNIWLSRALEIETDDSDSEEIKYVVEAFNKLFSNTNFKLKRFFREMATGTGIGLRYDLEFLVIRADWGFGLHLPYDTGKSGYFNIRRFKDMHTFHLAIGYPF